MRAWTIAAVCAAGWVATALESRRRYVEDGKALEAAREGLGCGYMFSMVRSARPGENRGAGADRDRQVISTAALKVGAALEARQPLRSFRGSFR